MEIFNWFKVRMLIRDLKDGDTLRRRAEAADTLGEIKNARAVEPLIQALKDKEWSIREPAAKALGKIGDTRAVEPLIQALNDEMLTVRMYVAEALGKIGDSRAVEPLIKALKDEDSQVREYVVDALGKLKDARAVEPLIQTHKEDEDNIIRAQAAEALIKIRNSKIVKPDIEKLKKNNDIEGLFKALEYRESATEDRKSSHYQIDLGFQYEAFKALAEIGDIGVLLQAMRNYKKVPGAVGRELPIFYDSHSNHAFSIILEKSDILPEEAVSILIESSQSDDESIREKAYENLGRAYKEASETDKPKIHDVLNRASEIEHGGVLNSVQLGHKWMSKYLDPDMQKKERVPILIKNLHNPSLDNYDLACCAEELIGLLELESIAYLTEAMKSSDFKIVSNATWALSHPLMNMSKRYDQKAFHEALVPAINYLQSVIKIAELSNDAEVYNWRVALAVTTIGKIGDGSVVPTLEELLSKVEKKVQETGVVQKYVNTGVAAGYISNEDYIKRIQGAMDNIKNR